MLDRDFILNNRAYIENLVKIKNVKIDLDVLYSLIESRKEKINNMNQFREKRNKLSSEIALNKREGGDSSKLLEESKIIAEKVRVLQAELNEIENKEYEMLAWIPNKFHSSVPDKADSEFKIVKQWGEADENPFSYYDIVSKSNCIDFIRGGKISASNFPLYLGKAAYLERVLINFMLDLQINLHGYKEIFPPFIVNERTMFSTGQLPKMKDDMYYLQNENLYLIPTAEPPVTAIYMDEILPYTEMPVKMTAYSACFRREAGSYGKDTKGLKRVHQFNKVEIVQYAEQEKSYQTHEEMLLHAEKVLQMLSLPYRVILLPANDMSFASAKTYDIEVWASGSKEYLEVSSVSNFEDFQARRANIRYRDKEGKNQFVHTLNGSGLATPRTVIAVIEKYQKGDDDFDFPPILNDYIKHGKAVFEKL